MYFNERFGISAITMHKLGVFNPDIKVDVHVDFPLATTKPHFLPTTLPNSAHKLGPQLNADVSTTSALEVNRAPSGSQGMEMGV